MVPFAPYMAEEIHAGLGLPGLAVQGRWPSHDGALLAEEAVEIAVQVNGKLRGRVEVPRGVTADAALGAARTDTRVQAAIGQRRILRTVFVPDRLLNVVLE